MPPGPHYASPSNSTFNPFGEEEEPNSPPYSPPSFGAAAAKMKAGNAGGGPAGGGGAKKQGKGKKKDLKINQQTAQQSSKASQPQPTPTETEFPPSSDWPPFERNRGGMGMGMGGMSSRASVIDIEDEDDVLNMARKELAGGGRREPIGGPGMSVGATPQQQLGNWNAQLEKNDFQWFSNPPPRNQPEPSRPRTPFEPSPADIERNEAIIFALKMAPTMLYDKFKQYGQLGVLGWSSEFSELVDEVKNLGFQGNMFTTTREAALEACVEILKLKLDIQMQLIVLFLSSQVARLRRFLDGDAEYSDYPEPTFPLPDDGSYEGSYGLHG